MKTLKLMRVVKRNGKETLKCIESWSGLSPRLACAVAFNFIDGFKLGTSGNWRYSLVAFEWQSWRYHDSDSGVRYYFTNRKYQVLQK